MTPASASRASARHRARAASPCRTGPSRSEPPETTGRADRVTRARARGERTSPPRGMRGNGFCARCGTTLRLSTQASTVSCSGCGKAHSIDEGAREKSGPRRARGRRTRAKERGTHDRSHFVAHAASGGGARDEATMWRVISAWRRRRAFPATDVRFRLVRAHSVRRQRARARRGTGGL